MSELQNERELLSRAQAGDSADTKCLLLRYDEELQQYVKAVLGEALPSADVIQQTRYRTGKELHTFPLDGIYPFREGLLKIAKEQCARALVAAVQINNRMASERLFMIYEEEIKNILTARLKAMFGYVDTMDVNAKWQEARQRMESKLIGFNYRENNAFAKYLTQIAKNLCSDAWNMTQPRDNQWLSQLDSMICGEDPSPSSQLARQEREQALHAVIPNLNSDQLKAIRMQLEGKTTGEIAAELNRTPGAIRMLLKRAKEVLREELGSTSLWFSKR